MGMTKAQAQDYLTVQGLASAASSGSGSGTKTGSGPGTKTGSGPGTKTGSGSGYNNGNQTRATIEALQTALGVTVDGKWGPATQAAAQKKWGTTSADEAAKKLDTPDSEETIVTNRHADSWVLVAGYGRLSWQELATKVDKGQIIEIENKDGSLSYKKKR